MTAVVECAREFLEMVRRSNAEAYGKISEIGEGMQLALRYGPDAFSVTFVGGEVIVQEGKARDEKGTPYCEVEPEAFFSILDAKRSLSEVIWSNSLEIRGTVQEILRVYQIMEVAVAASRNSPEVFRVVTKLRNSSRRK